MNDFQTVYDLLDSGYDGATWFLLLAGILVLVLVYLVWLKPASRGERIYRLILAAVWAVACGLLVAYHCRGYSLYRHMADTLKSGYAQKVTGAVTLVQPEGYFLYFDVAGRRFRCSRYKWPFRLGFQPGDFPLKPTFLVSVYTVDEVVVRLDVHRASLGYSQADK